jgi:dTDP-glucose 4,6-dehydratase
MAYRETYNIGGGAELPNLEVIEDICRGVDDAFAADVSLARRFPLAPAAQGKPTVDLKTFVQDRKGHDRRYTIDETKAREEIGYTPGRDFAFGIRDTIKWYLDNEAWWRPLLR